jgi:hypothetical protein
MGSLFSGIPGHRKRPAKDINYLPAFVYVRCGVKNYRFCTDRSSTSKISVAFGPIVGPAPR